MIIISITKNSLYLERFWEMGSQELVHIIAFYFLRTQNFYLTSYLAKLQYILSVKSHKYNIHGTQNLKMYIFLQLYVKCNVIKKKIIEWLKFYIFCLQNICTLKIHFYNVSKLIDYYLLLWYLPIIW